MPCCMASRYDSGFLATKRIDNNQDRSRAAQANRNKPLFIGRIRIHLMNRQRVAKKQGSVPIFPAGNRREVYR